MKKSFFFVFLAVLVMRIEGHPRPPRSKPEKTQIKIVATVFPLMEFSRSVARERGEVHLLLPPGAEVHTWQPRPSDIIKISSADVFLTIGADLEPWVPDVLKSVSNKKLIVFEASQILDMIHEEEEHGHGAMDPHVWLDFMNDAIIVNRIKDLLSELDPSGAAFFAHNAALLVERLRQLDDRFEDSLRGCRHRTLILGGHSAFAYLARRYGLQQISLYGLSPDSEPTPSRLIGVIELAKRQNIKAIYFETSVRPKLAKVLAKEVGAKILVLNPAANLTKRQMMSGVTFFDIMEENLKNLKDGLVCR